MANLKLIEKLAQKRGTTIEEISNISCIPVSKIIKMVDDGEGAIEDLEKIAAFLQVNPVIFFLSEKNLPIGNENGHEKLHHSYSTIIWHLTCVMEKMVFSFKSYEKEILSINDELRELKKK